MASLLKIVTYILSSNMLSLKFIVSYNSDVQSTVVINMFQETTVVLRV